jgi:hypothetical protein
VNFALPRRVSNDRRIHVAFAPLFPLKSGVVLVALLLTQQAHATSFAIHWQAPDSCGDQAAFEAEVSRIVGKPFAGLGSSWSTADVLIVPVADAWQLRVRVVSTSGARRERTLVAATCREAVEAAELIVATSLSGADLAADSEGASGEADAAPEYTPAAAAPQTPTPEVRPPRVTQAALASPSEPAPPYLRVDLGARIGFETVLFPAPTEIAWLMLGVEYKPIKVELSVGATRSVPGDVREGRSATFSLQTAGLVGCYGGSVSAFRLWGCAGAEVGHYEAQGRDPLDSLSNGALWTAALLQGELSWSLTRTFALGAGVQGALAGHPIPVGLSAPLGVKNDTLFTSRGDIRPWLGLEVRF